jgi:hypothetical protein
VDCHEQTVVCHSFYHWGTSITLTYPNRNNTPKFLDSTNICCQKVRAQNLLWINYSKMHVFLTVDRRHGRRGRGVQAKNKSVIVPYLAYFNNTNAAPTPPLRFYIWELKEPLNKRDFHLKKYFENIENEVFI